MRAPAVDEHAQEIARSRFALPPCLHVPIGARSTTDLERYIGSTEKVLAGGDPVRAVLLKYYDPHPPNPRLPIWREERSALLHQELQVWVHVDYGDYRRAYMMSWPELDLRRSVIDHILNREVARLKGFSYLRVIPISRAANSSSGGTSERWARNYHSSPSMLVVNRESAVSIQYADLADLVKMLDLKTGGSLQEGVNEGQALVTEPAPRSQP